MKDGEKNSKTRNYLILMQIIIILEMNLKMKKKLKNKINKNFKQIILKKKMKRIIRILMIKMIKNKNNNLIKSNSI